MIDMTSTIVPKSDQVNSDDLISGPMTITIERVTANPESSEQPVSIFHADDPSKPWRPCKSMRRVLVSAWGRDASQYVGRSLTLYRDPAVKFGGLEVGGIRISHMSHIDAPMTMALTATRASRKPFTVRPLEQVQAKQSDPITDYGRELQAVLKTGDRDHIHKWWHEETKQRRQELNIPTERLEKMGVAVSKALTPDEEGDHE
jgi:hypothetical protein